jgi:hypothetical protein
MSVPTPWEPKHPLDQRVSDADREQVAETLRVAAGDGRLSLAELDERLDACFAARTYGDLAGLVSDLPGSVPPSTVALTKPPKDLVRVKRIGGNASYRGAWQAPRRLEADLRGGNLVLDFSTATVASPVVEVDVRMLGGNVRLIVPDGFDVDTDEVEMQGGDVVYRRWKDRREQVPPTHRVVVTGTMLGGNLVVSPPRQPGRLRRMLGR